MENGLNLSKLMPHREATPNRDGARSIHVLHNWKIKHPAILPLSPKYIVPKALKCI